MQAEQRIAYASAHAQQYLDYAWNVAQAGHAPIDLLEFALISAHTPFEASVRGWYATRGLDDVTAIAHGLADNSVLAPYVKAARMLNLRDALVEQGMPMLPFTDWRRTHKLPGLGFRWPGIWHASEGSEVSDAARRT